MDMQFLHYPKVMLTGIVCVSLSPWQPHTLNEDFKSLLPLYLTTSANFPNYADAGDFNLKE